MSSGYLDGHAGLLKKEEIVYWLLRAGGRDTENPLWCMPAPDGGTDGGWNGNTTIPYFLEN